ncbi:MAG: metallophosphoesterase family protein [Pseudomonadota bacterium]
MKVCILSDSHDHILLLDAAVKNAQEQGAEAVLHCGDVVSPSTLKCLEKHGLPVHVIHGNNSGDLFALARLASQAGSVIHYYGMDAALELGGRRIFLVHYPHYARAMSATGDWDLVCCGHSHKPGIDRIANLAEGHTILVDPGTVGGVGNAPATWVLGDLESLEFSIHSVDKTLEILDYAQG